MTVIAWDGKTLAADKLGCSGNTRNTVTKIFRHGHVLLAIAGDLSVGMETIAWFRSGAIESQYPASNRDPEKGASLIVVYPDGCVMKYESSPHPFKMEGPFCAFGCGDESALIAMACGRTAPEAVGIVSLYNRGCGNGIDTLTFEI